MSMFSGKCDFYDGFVEIRCDGEESKVLEELSKLKLYVRGHDGREHRVKSDTIMDITKYYPYLNSIMMSSKDGLVVILASDSFIDQEEAEHRQYKIDEVYKYWRKCKRNKKTFTEEECVEALWYRDDDSLREIIRRIAKDGNKAEFDDIHMPMWEHCRRRWFEEMVRVGYTEVQAYNWCFKGMFDSKETEIKRLGRLVKIEG